MDAYPTTDLGSFEISIELAYFSISLVLLKKDREIAVAQRLQSAGQMAEPD